jgi:alpha-glucosidase
MRETVEAVYDVLPDFAWHHFVLTSHDFPRTASRFGGQGPARVAGMMLMTLKGTPTLYYGDELGFENGDIPPEKIQDPQGINLGPERTRDVARTPMQWNTETYAGFCTPDVEPWLPVSDDYISRNVEAQIAAPHSILNLYHHLLHLRRNTPALYGGDYRSMDVETEGCWVYLREADEERRLIALNFSDGPRTVAVPGEGTGRVVLSTHLDREEAVSLATLSLRPYEGVIIEL